MIYDVDHADQREGKPTMQKGQIEYYNTLICQYRAEPNAEIKCNIRNQIFLEIQSYMIKWISSILSKKNVFLEEDEMQSLSWDCFEFCLKNYKIHKNIPLPNHFYNYCRFFLVMDYLKKKKHNDIETDNLISSDTDGAFLHIDELKAYHSILDKEYKIIFEDAINSMCGTMKDRERRLNKSELSYLRYTEAKKIFKLTIDFLLRR